MHELEFEHLHVAPGDEVNEVAWSADNVELTTVGIDIGSSTSHMMFARVHLQRLGAALSSRFVVVSRRIIWQSPILLTPYLPDFTIDIDELEGFIGGCYRYADIEPADIDSGAVILTGEAIKRRNARAIAELFSEEAGRFVCASAGHHMECQLAAHGSGAVALSRGHGARLLNVDIGGGTTKFALIENGHLTATAAIAVGGRLIVEDPKQGLVRIEEPWRTIAESLGIELALGQALAPTARERMVARMVRLLMRMIDRRPPDELMRRLLVTDPWPDHLANKGIDALTFSGGVAEYLYKRETRRFGDLGSDLAHDLGHALAHRRDLPPVWDPGQGIRATVIGAAQFSVQISGNTILIADPDKLPLQNLPVLACNFDLAEQVDRRGRRHRPRGAPRLTSKTGPARLRCPLERRPTCAARRAGQWHLRGVAALADALPLVLLIDGDIAMASAASSATRRPRGRT
jgi:ethanolamine utilization protein EutA